MAVEHIEGLHSPDLVKLCGVLKICELEVILLGKQGPRARIDAQGYDEAIFCSGELGFPFRGRFALPAGWCLVGYLHYTDTPSWCHGTMLSSGMAFTVLPEGISEFMLAPGTHVSVVLVPHARLQRRYQSLKPLQPELPSRLIALFGLGDDVRSQASRQAWDAVRDGVLGSETHPTGSLRDHDVDALLDEHLLAGLSARAEDRPSCSRGRRAHYLVMQRAEEFMRNNLRRDIYITELCNAAGVSERALRYAFEDLLGVSPNRYLSMLRLCTACKNLTLSDASRKSVKSVALSCGLWDLSRFADHYRRVFGERPRDTLMRAPPFEAA